MRPYATVADVEAALGQEVRDVEAQALTAAATAFLTHTPLTLEEINRIAGPAPEKAETRMDAEIARRTDPPQPPDFDPPDARACIPPPAKFHDPELQRLSEEMDARAAAQGKPGAVDRLDCIEHLRRAMKKTGLESLYDEEALAATADAYISGMLAALARYDAERPPELAELRQTDETELHDRCVGAEVSAKALSDQVDALEAHARTFAIELCEALNIENPEETHVGVDIVASVRHIRGERDRLFEEARQREAMPPSYDCAPVRHALGALDGEHILDAANRLVQNRVNDLRDLHTLRVVATRLFEAMRWSGDAEPHAARAAWADLGEALFDKDDSRVVGLRAKPAPAAPSDPNAATLQTLDRVLRIGSAIVNLQRAVFGKGASR